MQPTISQLTKTLLIKCETEKLFTKEHCHMEPFPHTVHFSPQYIHKNTVYHYQHNRIHCLRHVQFPCLTV